MSGGETMTFVGFAHRGLPASPHYCARRGRRLRRPRLVGPFGGTGRYPAPPVPVLVAALGPRLPAAGELADGAMMWMAPVRAIETTSRPNRRRRVGRGDRATDVAGLPAPSTTTKHKRGLPQWPRLRECMGIAVSERILEIGGAPSPAEAAIVGSEISVRTQLQGLIDAGATDIWAAVFAVGDDKRASVRRPTDLLQELLPQNNFRRRPMSSQQHHHAHRWPRNQPHDRRPTGYREAAEDPDAQLDQHGVVVYREVNISDEGLLAFSRRLGTPVVQRRPRHVGQHRDVAPRLAL